MPGEGAQLFPATVPTMDVSHVLPARLPCLQARADFEGADLSDVLMDRAVIVEANLRNAILQRAVLTRSDLGQADIYGVSE
jgi:uncharacterized protein YjbI with pentapeptide repeats